MQNILVSLKFDATAVSSGAQAIGELEQGHLERHPYGLVLMDWMMPGMDGVETIRRIRSDKKIAETPAFVMVTAYSRDELMQSSADVQIDGVLVKPVSPSTLLDSILNALGKEVTIHTRRDEKRSNYQEAAQQLKGSHVLLVEDNAVNQELALEILQDAGLTVDVADNGKIAVEKVALNHYDAVLMDCQMPVMDGFDATRAIRKDARFAELPILAMTANAMAGDKEKCVECGMNDHIAKPIDVTHLFLTLAQWIKPKTLPDAQPTPTNDSNDEPSNLDGIPAIAGLDIDGALVRMGGSVKMLRKMISRFRETQTDVMARIKTAIENNDNDTAVREAHTVKGLSGNIGASELAVRSGLVEGMLKRGETEGFVEALDAMETELNSQIKQITSAIGLPESAPEATNAAPIVVDKDLFAKDLQQLAALLSDMDSSSSALAEKLSPQLNSLGQGMAARNLLKLVGEFEFDDALVCLQDAAKILGVAL
jgi:CheY-like chemotaxis protein